MRKSFWPIFATLILSGGISNASSLTEDFSELFESCRIAVEQSTPLNNTDLRPTQVLEKHSRSWGTDTSQIGWALPNSELYIVFTVWTSRDGPTRNLCDLHLRDPDRVLTEDEQGRLLRYFLLRQTQLIAQRTHEIDRRLSPIAPIMSRGFLLSAQNPRGCTVTNNIALLPDGTYFSAGSGEQAIKACDRN